MEILIILLLILLNGLFAMSEIAFISARRSNLEMQARQGRASARQALKLARGPGPVPLDHPDRHHADRHPHGYLLGRRAGRQGGRGAGWVFRSPRPPSRRSSPSSSSSPTSRSSSGELVPKRIGMNAAERMAKIMARPMRLLAAAASPFVWLLSKARQA